jgi:hypothetical protein
MRASSRLAYFHCLDLVTSFFDISCRVSRFSFDSLLASTLWIGLFLVSIIGSKKTENGSEEGSGEPFQRSLDVTFWPRVMRERKLAYFDFCTF